MSTAPAAASPDSKPKEKIIHNPMPWYTPRTWAGMRTGTLVSFLWDNSFRIHPTRLAQAAVCLGISSFNSVVGPLQDLIHGQAIRATSIEHPPIFILGHWRSGTTFLHELFMADVRYTTPTTHECFVPHHCLLTEWLFYNVMRVLLPANRPMDQVALGWDRPQEDEFAMCNLGVGSAYLRTGFPRRPSQYLEWLDFDGCTPDEVAKWKAGFHYFAQLVTHRRGKRIVFKSPPHTARLALIREIFPAAKFIHLVRDPFTLFRSTCNLWTQMDDTQGFQKTDRDELREYVFTAFERMYRAYFAQSADLAPGQLCEIRYEDLAARPVDAMQQIYEQLELGEYESVRPALEAMVSQREGYRTSQYVLDDDTRSQIAERWRAYIERYGYGRGEA